MTNSHKSQSEKLAAGGGREAAAKKPHNNEIPATPLTSKTTAAEKFPFFVGLV
jgi:hypothetical protein